MVIFCFPPADPVSLPAFSFALSVLPLCALPGLAASRIRSAAARQKAECRHHSRQHKRCYLVPSFNINISLLLITHHCCLSVAIHDYIAVIPVVLPARYPLACHSARPALQGFL